MKVQQAQNTAQHSPQRIQQKGDIGGDKPFQEEGFFEHAEFQPKLTIGQPNDRYEQEADQMADQVVQRLANSNSTPILQTKCTACEEENVQAKGGTSGTLISPGFQSQLNASKGGGQAMSPSLQSSMEGAFDADFSSVRLHTDTSAVQMNQEIGARAFTNGSDVYFNDKQFNASSSEGQHLLAHELTHVVQQDNTRIGAREQNNAHIIQRTSDNNQNSESNEEWVPQLAPTFTSLTGNLNSELTVSARVINNRPDNVMSAFNWRWYDSKSATKITAYPNGPTGDFKFKTAKVGTNELSFGVSYWDEFDDLGAITKSDIITLNVPEPSLSWKHKINGIGSGPKDMRQGDRVSIIAKVSKVNDLAKAPLEVAASLLLHNNHSLNYEDIPKEARITSIVEGAEVPPIEASNTKVTEDGIETEIRANRAGGAIFNKQIKFPGQEGVEKEYVIKAFATLEQFLGRLDLATDQIGILGDIFETYLNDSLSNYNAAYGVVSTILTERERTEQITEDTKMGIFILGLTIATSGGGQAVGAPRGIISFGLTSGTKLAAQHPSFSGVRNLDSYSVQVPGNRIVGGKENQVPTPSPFALYLKYNRILLTEKTARKFIIKNWKERTQAAIAAAADKKVSFDPVDAVNNTFRFDGMRVDELPPVKNQFEWEKILWSYWLSQHAYKIGRIDDPDGTSTHHYPKKNTGADVDEHLKRLNKELERHDFADPGWEEREANKAKEPIDAYANQLNEEDIPPQHRQKRAKKGLVPEWMKKSK